MEPDDKNRIHGALARLEGGGDDVPAEARHAAVAMLLRGTSLEASEILLMRRAEREGDRWSGQISFPGGHTEPEDEDLVATARRESREEVGVDPGAGRSTLFGALPTIQARARGARVPLFLTPIVFHRHQPEAPELGPEAAEAFWLPLRAAASGALDAPYRYEHEGLIHKLPSWDYEGRVIWGMTHGILSRFVTALEI